jgi:hypothetical protein
MNLLVDASSIQQTMLAKTESKNRPAWPIFYTEFNLLLVHSSNPLRSPLALLQQTTVSLQVKKHEVLTVWYLISIDFRFFVLWEDDQHT